MGLFKKTFAEKIQRILDKVNAIDLSEDVVIIDFSSKVRRIEEYDIECIRLLKDLIKAGHVSEKHKRAVLNQLIVLLRRLEKLRFEEKEQLEEVRKEIDAILMEELTVERIGIEVNNILYHGSGIANIKRFGVDMEEFDYLGSATLGHGIYCNDNKKMAVNYAFYRYNSYMKKEDPIFKKYGNRIKATVYLLRMKKGRTYFSDLNDPIKIMAIYKDLMEYCYEEAKKQSYYPSRILSTLADHLKMCIRLNKTFSDIRTLVSYDKTSVALQQSIFWVNQFLKDIGFHGLRCMESGEIFESIFKWQSAMSYLIFNPDDVEIIGEENYTLKNGRIIQIYS